MTRQRTRFWQQEGGYAMSFWAVFISTVLVPLMVLTIDVGRLFYTRGEIQKAADAAALAAVREVHVVHYMNTKEIIFHDGTVQYAQQYAINNTTYLRKQKISPRITRIIVNDATKTVHVQMEADVSAMFPAYLQTGTVTAWGEAQVRILNR